MPDLSDAYENGRYIPDAEAFREAWPRRAAAFREAMGARFSHGFEPQTRSGVDIVWPEDRARGLMVFVHGGYWRAFSPRDWSHLAQGALEQGWAVALPGYPLCPSVRIAEITQAVATGVTEAARRVAGPIALSGHSAGGHLVARMLAPGMLPDAVATRVARVAPISMLSDLTPLMQTEMNTDLRIDEAEARAESPLFQIAPADVEVALWVGGAERPAFLDQSHWLGARWGVNVNVVPGRHHFDVIDALEDSESDMVRWLVAT